MSHVTGFHVSRLWCILKGMQRVWIVVGCVMTGLVGFVVLIAGFWFYALKHSAFYATCLQFARNHPQIRETIGELRASSYFPIGFYEESGEERSGEGTVSFTIRGSEGTAYLSLSAYRRFAHWVIDGAQLYRDGTAERLDTPGELIQATEHLSETELRTRMEHVLAIQPHVPEPHYLLGDYYLERRHYARAERAFREAIALDPAYGPGYNELGVALMRQERYQDALAVFRQATTIAPDDPYPYLNQATIYLEVIALRDLALSRTLLDEAATRDPDPVLWQEILADLSEAEGDPEAALAARERARQLRLESDRSSSEEPPSAEAPAALEP